MPDLAKNILRALSDKKSGLLDDARQILNALEYDSERTLDETHSAREFLHEYDPKNGEGINAKELQHCAQKIGIVFQVGDEEINHSANGSAFQRDDDKSFIFVAADLDPKQNYPRWRLARITRAVNRCFASPAVVLFRHLDADEQDSISLSFIHRRQSKIDSAKDVLGRVSILRGIRRQDPHRGHLDILKDLALTERAKWMEKEDKPKNFDGLLTAWLNALDTETLNKRFYTELFEWFVRAVKTAQFPNPGEKPITPEEQTIRLVTRLLFIWFIKEKGLVADDFFRKEKVRKLLARFDHKNGDYYYCAILQNLFFATLNTEIGKRRFSKESSEDHRNFNVYRHAHMLQNRREFEALMKKTPFVNGGLFDCMDSEDSPTSAKNSGKKQWRQDHFSDPQLQTPQARDKKRQKSIMIPDRLFFHENGTDGIVDLLHRYKFTVEENTPLDQEVALDPELLGMVFENLLAAITPESRDNARKKTGSYYTPRPVVEYMVDEALVAYLAERIGKKNEKGLRQLMNWEESDKNLFSKKECKAIIDAIDELRILDPAVGSGAFPMGMLHKLVHILKRVDERNEEWKRKQLKSLENMPDSPSHREAKRAIEQVFSEKNNYDDYGRKLFLIQNAIHGTDLQPVAVQIARLRFFISLIIDQKPRDDRPNHGIEPLPNLETKFVAADTLVQLSGSYSALQNLDVVERQEEIAKIRRAYFGARTRKEKLSLKKQDAICRADLAATLQSVGDWGNIDAQRYSDWDIYDQTAGADWFDAEFMLGVGGRFDIVIGNPPYLESRNHAFSKEKKAIYQKQARRDWHWIKNPIPPGADLLVYFFPRAIRELKRDGIGIFIVQNSWLHANYGRVFQQLAMSEFSVTSVVDSEFRHFIGPEAPSVNTVITAFTPKRGLPLQMRSMKNWGDVAGAKKTFSAKELREAKWKWGVLFESSPWLIEILGLLRADQSKKSGIPVVWGQGINEPKHFYLTADDAALRFGIESGKLRPVLYEGARFDFLESEHFLIHAANMEKAELIKLHKQNAPIFQEGERRKIPDLIMPRGLGRHYCALNRAEGFSYSGVECRIDLHGRKQMKYSVWVLMNSSLMWLYREISGRKNLGGGMLKAEATDMKQLGSRLHIPDMESEARKIFESLRDREPLPSLQEIETPEHRAIDALVCRALGCEEYEERIQKALQEAIALREKRARTN